MWAATGKNNVYDFSGIFGESPKIPAGTGRGRGQPYGQGFGGKIPKNPLGDGVGKGDNLELGDFGGKSPKKLVFRGGDEGRILRDFPLSSI